MNREILFRGKTENGEWVEGFYTKGFRDPQQKQLDDLIYMFSGKSSEWDFDYARVIPETVGQFTGSTDKNGKKIFEGDILINIPRKTNNAPAVLHIIKDICRLSEYVKRYAKYMEIVGNIYDNKELLEVENG